VKTILKRTSPAQQAATRSVGALRLDRGGHSVAFGEAVLSFTALEFSIVDALLSRPNIVFSRSQLMEAAYGTGTYVADRTIDSHIRNIRAKLAAVGGDGIIATVHGIGFKLAVEPASTR